MKPIKEYEKDGGYEDENECWYDDLQSFLHIKCLGFCGCGNPEYILKLIYEMLILKEKRSSDLITYDQYDQLLNELIANNIDTIQLYFEYLLDKQNITTHGGSVYGSWVDDNNFLEALKLWHKEYGKHGDE